MIDLYSNFFIAAIFVVSLFISCAPPTKVNSGPLTKIEILEYFSPSANDSLVLIKTKYTYFNEVGEPNRWIEIDSSGKRLMDYLYEYDSAGELVKAYYMDPEEDQYSVERFSYPNDTTMITEWLDSSGQVYYTMVDELNEFGKTVRATFSDSESTHGYDTTLYNDYGYPRRIYFTNVRGKRFNNRRFVYDSYSEDREWLKRRKLFRDSLAEVQVKEFIYLDTNEVVQYNPKNLLNSEN